MQLTNDLALPEPFVDAAHDDHGWEPKVYSTTTLLKGAREVMLERRHDTEITEDVADRVWAIFGTATHSILEKSQETETQLKENRIYVDMPGGYRLSGIFDLYDDATGTVTDYKTTSVWKAVFDDYADWRRQLLTYVWMLRQIGFDAHCGEIVAILKDHSKRKAQTDSTYPQHSVHRISWNFTDEDFVEEKAWLDERFAVLMAAEKLPDDQLPECTPDERWAKPAKWAVKKAGNKKATKLWDSEQEACDDADARTAADSKNYVVEYRPGEDGKCDSYCSAHAFCSYWQAKHKKEA